MDSPDEESPQLSISLDDLKNWKAEVDRIFESGLGELVCLAPASHRARVLAALPVHLHGYHVGAGHFPDHNIYFIAGLGSFWLIPRGFIVQWDKLLQKSLPGSNFRFLDLRGWQIEMILDARYKSQTKERHHDPQE